MSLITIVGSPVSNSYATLEEANEYFANRPDAANWKNKDYKERERVLKMATIDLDTLRYKGNRFFDMHGSDTYAPQALQFPRSFQEYYTGTADSGTTLTLVDTYLHDYKRNDNFFKYGALYIIDGTNEGVYKEVSAYNYATSTVTVSTAFSNAIDYTSQYYLLAPINMYVKYALFEQALFLTNSEDSATKFAEWQNAGVSSVAIGDVKYTFAISSAANRFMDKIGSNIASNCFRYIRQFVDTNNPRTGRA